MDKKDIALVIIIFIIMIFLNPILTFFGIVDPPSEVANTPQDSTQVAPLPLDRSSETNQSATQFTLKPQELVPSQLEVIREPAPVDSVIAETTLVVTNKYTIIMTSLGGGPVSIRLSEYTYKDGEQIELLQNSEAVTPDLLLSGGNYSTAFFQYSSDKEFGRYDVTSEPFEISYQVQSDAIGTIVKTYRFYPDDYHYDLHITVSNPERFGAERSYQVNWNTPLGVTEPTPQTDYEAMQAVTMMGGARETLDDFNNNRLTQELTGSTSWAGVRNKYFAGVIIPKWRQGEAAFAAGFKRDITTPDGSLEEKRITAGIKMGFPAGTAFTDTFTVFAGPLDYSLMSTYDVGLEDILDIGTTPFIGWIIKPFALAIIWILPRMYDIIPNYGLVIILFALFVKIVTMPLSMKSFKSMNAMKELQPKVDKLKEKHKKDPKALNTEMMALYKEHGVSPISGCLPMLPQMPLFFALFSVFRSTILLRQSPFFWFFDDLSRGASGFTDPYILLVLVMVGAQFLSQSLTMASNQQNKMLMYMMPVVMGYFFHTFAAGLVLYWTCFSLFSLLDYLAFKRNKNTNVKTA